MIFEIFFAKRKIRKILQKDQEKLTLADKCNFYYAKACFIADKYQQNCEERFYKKGKIALATSVDYYNKLLKENDLSSTMYYQVVPRKDFKFQLS